MVISSALLSKIVGALGLLLTFAPASAEVALVGCLPSVTAAGQTHHLETIEIFDGNPAARVLLAPVMGKWDLREVREPARDFYLVCKYSGTAADQTFVVPKDAKWCRVMERSRIKMAVCR